MIKQPTCYKNPDKPTCIDLILTHFPRIFQSTCVTETRLSDFHLMTKTVTRKIFKKISPRVIGLRVTGLIETFVMKHLESNNFSNEVFVKNDDGLENWQNNYGYFKLINTNKEKIC